MLFPLVKSTLLVETLRAWKRFRGVCRTTRDVNIDETSQKLSEKSELDSLLQFLQDEGDRQEIINLVSQF